jgi:hypothetical protein
MNDFLQFMQDAAIRMYDVAIYSNHPTDQATLKLALEGKRRILCNHDPLVVDHESMYVICTKCGLKI